jgi:hypothetical protein
MTTSSSFSTNTIRTAFTASLLLCTTHIATAQDAAPNPKSFSLTQEIQGTELEEGRRTALRALMFDPLTDTQRQKTEKLVCAPMTTPVEQGNEQVKAALHVTDTTLSPEILFGKGAPGNEPESPDFSVSLKFEQDHLLARLSLPRFPSEAGGLQIPYPQQPTRTLWMEGKGASDMVVIVPAVQGCAVKAVILCPRTYISQGTLAPSQYTPNGIRYSYTTKIDGLYATGSEMNGTLRGSLRSTKGIPLPKVWYSEDIGKRTPSVSLKYSSATEKTQMPFISGAPPILGGIEASLEFGQGETLIHRSFTRNHLEVREFPIEQTIMTSIENAQLQVQPGMCYLVTQWQTSSNK